jgi:hypothetical protein
MNAENTLTKRYENGISYAQFTTTVDSNQWFFEMGVIGFVSSLTAEYDNEQAKHAQQNLIELGWECVEERPASEIANSTETEPSQKSLDELGAELEEWLNGVAK